MIARMKPIAVLLVLCALVATGCGDNDSGGSEDGAAPGPQADTGSSPEPKPAKPGGTVVTVGKSEYGPMLFDSNGQAIYIFENDPKGKTVCYDDCEEAWPPVFTKGEPQAGKGVEQSLLGTVKRRDGKRQITYAGKPLYLYAHEGPGEVRCHNVELNGGLWWVVGPDGKRRP